MEEMKRVLVVDDDPFMRMVLLRSVGMRGHDVTTCDGAEEALCLLASETFDTLVTDQVMAGMCGAELVRIVQQRYPHMRCVVLSGLHAPNGFTPQVHWLAKPCPPEVLDAALSAAS